jgi:hypothetical protein
LSILGAVVALGVQLHSEDLRDFEEIHPKQTTCERLVGKAMGLLGLHSYAVVRHMEDKSI